MSCESETTRELRGAGRRFTVQRLKVAAALRHAGGHRTAEEIRALVQQDDPHAAMPLSTVYRTLGTLKALRLVAEADAGGGPASYEWIDAEQPHHHLVCVECGAERDFDSGLLTLLGDAIRAASEFEVHLDHVTLQGRCGPCRDVAEARGRR